MEFMSKCPIKTLFTLLFARTFFITSKGPSLQLPSVVSKVLETSLFVDSVGSTSELQLG